MAGIQKAFIPSQKPLWFLFTIPEDVKLKWFQGREEHKIKMPLAGMESKEEMMGERRNTMLGLQERKILLADQS